MANNRTAIAGLAIVTAQISINSGAALAKGLFPLVGPEGVAALRTTLSALILLALARPWRAKLSARQWAALIPYGLTLGSMNLLIYWAFQRIPIGIAVAIEICGPLALILATSRTLRDGLWFLLALGSLLLLIPWPGGEAKLDPVGILFALGAALCWALYILFGKRASAVSGSVAVSIGMSIACAITLPFGGGAIGFALGHPSLLGTVFFVALLSSALPYFLEMKALERVSSRMFGVIISCAPATGALAGFFLLGERLAPMQWCAIAGMIAASAGCSLTSRRPAVDDAAELPA